MTLKQAVKQTEKKFERIITAIAEGNYRRALNIDGDERCGLCRKYRTSGWWTPPSELCDGCPLEKIGKRNCYSGNPLFKLYHDCIHGKYYDQPDKAIPNLLALYMWLPMLLEVE